MTDLIDHKAALRRRLRALRKAHVTAIGPCGLLAEQRAVMALLEKPIATARAIAAYAATGSEFPLDQLIAALVAGGRQIALPRIGPAKSMRFLALPPGGPMPLNILGIPEPPADAAAIAPDVLLVPVVGASRTGVRLGQGGGYYDRWLAAATSRPLVIGVAFACQLVDALPREPHDMLLDAVVTPDGWIDCRANPPAAP